MQQTVRKQETNLPLIAVTVALCLLSGIININKQIAEILLFFFYFKTGPLILSCKGNYICRTVDSPVIPVDRMNRP